jgi:hypothetical protein
VVHGLRQRGADVLTVAEANMLGASDWEHLLRASNEGRVLFTQEPGSQGTSIGDIIHGLTLIYQVMELEDMKDHVEFL